MYGVGGKGIGNGIFGRKDLTPQGKIKNKPAKQSFAGFLVH